MKKKLVDIGDFIVKVINRETGEEVDVVTTFKHIGKDQWEKVVAKNICDIYSLIGNAKTKLLSHIIKERNCENLVYGSYREFADGAGVSIAVVKTTFPVLIREGFVKKKGEYRYMVNPAILRPGNRYKGAVLFKIWDEK